MNNSCQIVLEPLTVLSCGRHDGWVGTPQHRGTFDILRTCLFTIFISTYTILCLNLPAPQDRKFTVMGRRLKWMVIGILCPEMVLTFAAGQWSRAKHSVADFHGSGYTGWTIQQAFFADMGGFLLDVKDVDTFPLNAKQLHWLVVNKKVDYPDITTEDISDRSKQDTLAKLITAVQMGYLIIHATARAIQDLPITALELNALSIVVCSIMTSIAWFRKPHDVNLPVVLTTIGSESMEEMLGGRAWTDANNTPLDFIDENGPGWSMNLMPFMKMPTIPTKRPIQRIPNDRFPMNPYGRQEYYLCFATLLFTAVHVAGWNLSFPTYTEKLLWRISSLILFGATAGFWLFETMASWVRLGRWKRIAKRTAADPRQEESSIGESKVAVSTSIQEVTPETFKRTVLPLLWEFCAISPLALVFGVARGFLLVEGFLELRAVPAEAFQTVQWTAFLPHA